MDAPYRAHLKVLLFVWFAFVCMNVCVSLGMDTVHACCNIRVLVKEKVLTSYRVWDRILFVLPSSQASEGSPILRPILL